MAGASKIGKLVKKEFCSGRKEEKHDVHMHFDF